MPDSVKYIPVDALGQASFAHAFEAKYENPGEPATAIVVPFDNDEKTRRRPSPATSRFSQKRSGKTKVSAPGNGGFSATDSFQGFILAVRAGPRLVISLGAPEERAAAIVTDIVKRLGTVQPGQPRKEGSR